MDGYCDPVNGLPTGMTNEVRDTIQDRAAIQRADDEKWLGQRHLGKEVQQRTVLTQLESPSLGTLADKIAA